MVILRGLYKIADIFEIWKTLLKLNWTPNEDESVGNELKENVNRSFPLQSFNNVAKNCTFLNRTLFHTLLKLIRDHHQTERKLTFFITLEKRISFLDLNLFSFLLKTCILQKVVGQSVRYCLLNCKDFNISVLIKVWVNV